MVVGDLRARLESHIDGLPVLPTVVARLMVLDPEGDGYFEEVLALIEADPPFAARILSSANAAASSPIDPVASVRGALVRLGSHGASNAIMAAAVARVFIPRNDWEKSLWRHALQVAMTLRILAELDPRRPIDPDVAYAAGLLHDVGRLVMFQEAPEELQLIDEGDWDNPESLVEAERAICGITHAELGARACRRWRLPEILVEVVGRHHHPVARPVGQVELLVAMGRFADLAMFPSAMPGTPGHDLDDDDTLVAHLLPKLPPNLAHLGPGDLRRTLVEATERAETMARSIGLG